LASNSSSHLCIIRRMSKRVQIRVKAEGNTKKHHLEISSSVGRDLLAALRCCHNPTSRP
ncbi:hypothetical protein D047_2799B, partial [Vibrio parahaemolyticus VPTS-2010_2]